MTDKVFLLRLPVARWEPEHNVPDAASEAVQLAVGMRNCVTSLDVLSVVRDGHERTPAAFDVSATLRWKIETSGFLTSVEVRVAVMDQADDVWAELLVGTSARWDADETEEILPDAADTYAIAMGCLEPMSLAARTIESSLELLGVAAQVSPDTMLNDNMRAVYEMSSQPPMSSELASPLNPYALEGIAGVEADQWAAHGFPASSAADWDRHHFDASAALEWDQRGFDPDAAQAWRSAGAFSSEAEVCREEGIEPPQFTALIVTGVLPLDYLELRDVVPAEEAAEWLEGIGLHELLEPADVRTLVAGGLSSGDLFRVPPDLTALEIVRYVTTGALPEEPDTFSGS